MESNIFEYIKPFSIVLLLIITLIFVVNQYKLRDEPYLGEIAWVGRRREWFSAIRSDFRALRNLHAMSREGYNRISILIIDCHFQGSRKKIENLNLFYIVFKAEQSLRSSFPSNRTHGYASANKDPRISSHV
jgi:hypothetical protein